MAISKAGFVSGAVSGLLSGTITFAFINWLSSKTAVSDASKIDAIAIANTYIVLTTIIFAAITVFLAMAGLWFTHQFSSSKEVQMTHLFNELESELHENDQIGIKLMEKVIANPDVSRHVQSLLETKLDQLLDERKRQAQSDQAAISALSSGLAG